MITSVKTAISQIGQQSNDLPPDSLVFGRTTHMQALRSRIEKAAASEMPVLVQGESGTGKDIIARILHRQSPWRSGLFVKARCSCIPDGFDDLLASSGHVITGVPQSGKHSRPTRYGTLFLDEISESSSALQAKLLRFLQEGQSCRLNLEHCKLNMRLICATNSGLEDAVERGRFRKDLLYRINVLTMRVPSLRERMIDIPDLVSHFLDLFNTTCKCEVKRPSRNMLHSLLSYSWPGNIRELANLMKRYVLFGCEESVCDDLVTRTSMERTQDLSEPGAVCLKEITRKAVRELERDAILKVLQANHWNRKRAACVLNISYRSLLYKLKDAGMDAQPSGSAPAARQVAHTAAM